MSCKYQPAKLIKRELIRVLVKFKLNLFKQSFANSAHTGNDPPSLVCIPKRLHNKQNPPELLKLTFYWIFTVFQTSVHENCRTCRTFPMARAKCPMRDFINFNRIYKAHQTIIWWTMKVFRLHCQTTASHLPQTDNFGGTFFFLNFLPFFCLRFNAGGLTTFLTEFWTLIFSCSKLHQLYCHQFAFVTLTDFFR